MPANGQVEVNWADGSHTFNIAKIKSVLELEDKCEAGVSEVFQRISDGKWKINDVRETIRLGLIGGGMTPDASLKLVQRYVDDRPWAESVPVAMVVLMAAIVGVPGDPLEKKQETERTKEDRSTAKMDDMSAPSSTDLEPPSDSILAN